MTARRVIITEEVALSLGRYMDDPAGLAGALNAIDALGEDPRPPASFHRGEYHRPRAGCYRVLYEITEDTVLVRHIGRVATRQAGGLRPP